MRDPIAFTVTRYRCPTCPRTGSSKTRVRDHMGRCWSNPDNRGCKTCKHFEPYSPSDCDGLVNYGEQPEHCAVGVDLRRYEETWEGEGPEVMVLVPMPNGATRPIVHCEMWEAMP